MKTRTMAVHVKCFASLRQELGIAAAEISHRCDMTVGDVWKALTEKPPPVNLLCAHNFNYVNFHQPVADDDEVAFFPPVSGG